MLPPLTLADKIAGIYGAACVLNVLGVAAARRARIMRASSALLLARHAAIRAHGES